LFKEWTLRCSKMAVSDKPFNRLILKHWDDFHHRLRAASPVSVDGQTLSIAAVVAIAR
jgi:hypothetical protein